MDHRAADQGDDAACQNADDKSQNKEGNALPLRPLRVAFPKGRWMDANGREYEGRQTRTLPAPLNTLLWFRRV